MGSTTDSILVPFLGAVQASFAVLLTIFYGVLAAQFNLISEQSAKDVSKMCVKLFLPALLIVNVGSELHLDTAVRYVPVLIWSFTYTLLSLAIGVVLTRWLKLPRWVTPAIAFNNTTALPLLLIESLDATGILKSIDSSSDAVARAKSFFLVNSMVGNSLTFALGPKFLEDNEETKKDGEAEEDEEDANGHAENGHSPEDEEEDLEAREQATEDTSLLPNRAVDIGVRTMDKSSKKASHFFSHLPAPVQYTVNFLDQFVSPPVIGAAIGALVGLVPALHRLFFNEQEEGGYLNAWLTASVSNVGDLFAALQIVVVGVKLSQSLLRMKKGEASGSVPWKPMVIVTFVRFIFWPLISIPIIWAFAAKTSILPDDPMLWLILMLMPTGPPALSLMSLADVSGGDDEQRMSVSKFLTISYAVSPLICFGVVGSLKACEAAMTS